MSDRRYRNRIPRSELPPFDEQLAYPMPEACGYLSESHVKLFEYIREGSLRVIRRGRGVFVPGSEIVRMSQLA
jgi:hypothetical protein